MSVWSRMGWFLAALPTTAVVCLAQAPSVVAEDFPTLVKRLQAEKPIFAKRQQDLLAARYDLADRPARGTAMSRGKPVQDALCQPRRDCHARNANHDHAHSTVEDLRELGRVRVHSRFTCIRSGGVR